MINFTRAFDSAWERMMVILFRPFDLGKWCVLGFSAFLAGLLSGGNGLGPSYNQNIPGQKNGDFHAQFQQLNAGMTHFISSLQGGLIALLACAFFIFVVALAVLIYWLGARGQFLLLDNVVRNRAVIAWPWQFYARPANGVFVLYLIFIVVSIAVLLVAALPAVILYWPFFSHPSWPSGGRLMGLIVEALIYLAISVVLTCVILIFREWGIPLMFRNGLTARAAFVESLGLIARSPGSVILFILLRLALFIGAAVLSLLACCLTCCLAAVPYLGTVVLLPAIIYIRCFSLDCLAQFGPAYDVFTVDVPPADTAPAVGSVS